MALKIKRLYGVSEQLKQQILDAYADNPGMTATEMGARFGVGPKAGQSYLAVAEDEPFDYD